MKKILILLSLWGFIVNTDAAENLFANTPNYDKATKQIDLCCQLTPIPKNLQAEIALTVKLIKAKKIDDALKQTNLLIDKVERLLSQESRRAIASYPNEAMILLNLTYAANIGEESVYLVSQDWSNPYYLRAYIYIDKKETEPALKALDKMLAFSPFDPQTLNERGHLYSVLKDWDKAEKDFQTAREMAELIKHQPFESRAIRGLGYVAIEKKQWDKAIGLYQQALKINPQDRIAQTELQYIEKIRN